VRIGQLLSSFVRADVRLSDMEPYRHAGSDAYELLDIVPPASWARLAAWNAFFHQTYADCLLSAGSSGRYVMTDIALYARLLYSWASFWVIETRKAQASNAYQLAPVQAEFPHSDRVYTGARLTGMRVALDTGRTRAAYDFQTFEGDPAVTDTLRVRLAQVDAEAEYVARLWTQKPSEQLCGTLGYHLTAALDHAFELGQVLAQPELLHRRP
jgi:hypothetical protein